MAMVMLHLPNHFFATHPLSHRHVGVKAIQEPYDSKDYTNVITTAFLAHYTACRDIATLESIHRHVES
jgi:hypothetical protein